MAITKNLTDLMNGDIRVESRSREGSVFTVALPLQFQDAAPEAVPEEWVGIHCLIVDDDEQTCENASELLEDMGLLSTLISPFIKSIKFFVIAIPSPVPVTRLLSLIHI